jgi:hypothetical protein
MMLWISAQATLSKTLLLFSCLFRLEAMMSLAHVFNVKVDKEGSVRLQSGLLIEAAIGD